MKTKRKTKTTIFSIALICLFAISLATTTNAAYADPIMTVEFESEYYEANLPIRINVLFTWAPSAAHRLEYVYLTYNVNSKVIDGSFRITYDWDGIVANARPTRVTLEIPTLVARSNDTLWFKISYIWHTLWGEDQEVAPIEKYKIDILYEGQKEAEAANQMTLYIILGSAGAVLLIALAVMYTIRRRR